MEVLCMAVMAIACITCFIVGARVGQKVSKGEEVQLPSVDPFKAYKEHEKRKKADAEQERLNAILHNVEVYDGTSKGQKEVK